MVSQSCVTSIIELSTYLLSFIWLPKFCSDFVKKILRSISIYGSRDFTSSEDFPRALLNIRRVLMLSRGGQFFVRGPHQHHFGPWPYRPQFINKRELKRIQFKMKYSYCKVKNYYLEGHAKGLVGPYFAHP